MPSKLLSKTKYLNGLQCPKYLWVVMNEPERVPEPDAATQHIFDQGHLVGELAKKLYPEGIDIPDEDFLVNIRKTTDLLQKRKPLFQAGIMAGRLYARADILNPVRKDEWDVIEVKSSTSVKDVNLQDVAFQKHCYEEAGLKIRNCYLAYINNQYIKQGEIDARELFGIDDITDEVDSLVPGVQGQVDEMIRTIALKDCPDVPIGGHCNSPYGCALVDECWSFLPEDNVFNLYYGGKKSLALFQDRVMTVRDIPEGFKLNDKQCIQRECEISGNPHIDREEIGRFLEQLRYPLYYLDFETFSTAVPMFDGTHPYQNIPFQYSLHVVEAAGAKPKHYSHLAEGTGDPRPALIAALEKVIGGSGSVVAYNKSFEANIIRNLGESFIGYEDWADSACERMVDLLVPFRSFHYYHPKQKGSASMKAVLPAITGWGYENLGISDGQEASIKFFNATYGHMADDERTKIRTDLEEYCGLDTEGMTWIVNELMRLRLQ